MAIFLVQVCWQQILLGFVYLKISLLHPCFWIFSLSNSQAEIFFFFYHFKDFIPISPSLHCFWWKINSHSHFSSVWNAFFPKGLTVDYCFVTLCKAYAEAGRVIQFWFRVSLWKFLPSWGSWRRLLRRCYIPINKMKFDVKFNIENYNQWFVYKP